MPVITFSLPQSIYEQLASKALDDSESPNLVAKRLILGFLGDGSNLSLDESSKLLSRIETLESRLDESLDGSIEDAIANHPKFKAIENELRDELKELRLSFTGLSIPIPSYVPKDSHILEVEKNLDTCMENNPSQDSLEDASNKIQVSKLIEEITPLKSPIF